MDHLASDLIETREIKTFGHYVVLRRLGEGPLSETLLARDGKMPRGQDLVVLRRLASGVADDGELGAALLEGAAVAAILDHPNIVGVFDGGRIDEDPFVAIEHVAGPTLDGLSSGRPMPAVEALELLSQVCSAAAHAHGFVDEGGVETPLIHGGLRPRGILVSSGGTVKVTGFELAGLATSDAAPDAATDEDRRPYLAPEQLVGSEIDERTDVFACGAILYRLLTGRDPVSKGGGIPAPRQLVPDLPREIGEIVERSMSADPAERYPSCEELALAVKELRRALAGLGREPAEPAEEPPSSEPPAPARPPAGNTLVGWTAAGKAAREEALLDEAIEALDDLGASSSAQPLLDDDIEELPSTEVILDEAEASSRPQQSRAEQEMLQGLAAPRRDPSASEAPRPMPAPRPTPRPRRAVGAAPPPPPPVARRPVPPVAPRNPSPTPPPPPLVAQPAAEGDDDPTVKSLAVDFDALPSEVEAALAWPPQPTAEGDAAASAEVQRPRRRWGLVIALASVVVVLGGGSAAGALTTDLWLPQAQAMTASVATSHGLEVPWGSAPTTPLPAYVALPAAAAPSPAPAQAGLWPTSPPAPLPAPTQPQYATPAAPAASSAVVPAAPAARSPEPRAETPPAAVAPEAAPAAPAAAEERTERPRAAARPAGTGYLSVLTTPYSRVYMDGRLLGTTPILRRQVPAGRHTLRLVTEQGAARRVPVAVERDGLSQVRQNLW